MGHQTHEECHGAMVRPPGTACSSALIPGVPALDQQMNHHM
jgi:hypothetical protein